MSAYPASSSNTPSNLELGDMDKKSDVVNSEPRIFAADDIKHDAVFGEISEDGPNYRAVGWKGAAVLLAKAQIGLGVLGIPWCFHTLGIIPGIIVLILCGIITTWSSIVIGHFKLAHPEVYSVADAGRLMFGRFGAEACAATFWLFMVFVSGAAMNGLSTALNALSMHGACTAVFVAVAAIVIFAMSLIPTLGRISILGWIGLFSILSALFTLTIATGVQDRPAGVTDALWATKEVRVTFSAGFLDGITAVSTLIFAFAVPPSCYGVVSEMRNPKHFTRSIITCQIVATAMYIICGTVVYYFCGQFVASPALGSAGPLMKRVCYGLALPGLLVSGILYTHIPAKYLFVRLLANSEHLSKNTVKHWVYWVGCVFACTAVAYLLGSAVPGFGDLVGLIGALLGTILCLSLPSYQWIYLHRERARTDKSLMFRLGMATNIIIILLGAFICVGGTYASVLAIKATVEKTGAKPFSCADNSGSVM